MMRQSTICSSFALLMVGVLTGPREARGQASASVDAAVLAAERQRINVIAEASKTAVSVFAAGKAGGGGSGVVISPDGYALTNFHVAKPCGNHMKCSMNDGTLYDAVIVGIDPTGDVALMKLLGRDDFPCAVLGNSDLLEVGQWCFAVGNPFLLATDFQPTVTYGIVSGVHRYQYPAGTLLEYADCIQTDASINPGNSGGPLFNSDGHLVGINGRGSFEKRGRVNVGVGYAISINQIKNFMGHLRSGRIVDHATLGASVSTDEDGRVVVTNILDSSDAYRRGLRYGDEIISFASRPIETVNAFKNALGIFPKGWRVPLSYRRDNQRFEILVRLSGVHAAEELFAKTQRAMGPPDPGPKPDDKPPGGDGDRPDPEKKPRIQLPRIPAAATLPEHVAKVFKARRGFANYYFNQLGRQRVWNALTNNGDFTLARDAWTLAGQLNVEGRFRALLSDRQVLAHVATADAAMDVSVDLDQDLETQLEPDGSGGLCLALSLWRRFLVEGPERFGDVIYLGTAPLPGHDEDPLVDVLQATFNVIEARFYFSPTSGLLLAMEVYPDSEIDPCELYFRDYGDVDGRQLPSTIDVIHGDQRYGVITVNELVTPVLETDA